jgi:large subunit ribosomal protein L22
MEAIAKTKYLKGSPRKARLVVDLIRGRNVSQALAILKFTDKRASGPIAKCLNSAIANATYKAEQENIAIDPDDLWVKTCFVDMGPTKGRRRMRPAPQGRAYREQRHYCHITIQVTSEEAPKTEKELKAEAAKARKEAAKKTEAKTEKKKAAPKAKKETKKAKAEKAEEIETPVSEAAPEEVVAETKEAASEPAVEKEKTKPADEKQQEINEELERQ